MKKRSFYLFPGIFTTVLLVVLSGFVVNVKQLPRSLSSPGVSYHQKSVTNMANDSFNMNITRVFDAPVERVWKAWSTEEYIRQWWGPRMFTCPVAKVNFTVGGTTLVCMKAPKEYGGMDMWNTWTYSRIVSFEMIEFVQGWSDMNGNRIDPSLQPGLPPGLPQEIRHVLTFKKLADNKTQLDITEYGYSSIEMTEMSKGGMGECLDKMAEALAK